MFKFAFITQTKLLMRKTYFLQGILLLFMAFQFTACDNEPLEGEFPEDPGGAGTGQFVATIAGQHFVAEEATGLLNDGRMLITGGKADGEAIVISVENVEEGTFDLGWEGLGSKFARYSEDMDSDAYVTNIASGGSGELNITALDNDNNTISGTFMFKGVREKLDSSGEPILDDDGNPVMEDILIENGSFNEIPFMSLGGRGYNK